MSNAIGSTKIKQANKSDEFTASDICICFLAIFGMISIIYSMFILSNINDIIMDKNLTTGEIQARDAYPYFVVIGFLFCCLFTMLSRFDGLGSKTLAYILLILPAVVFVGVEVMIITNQLTITHFRASNLYPSENNLALFTGVIKGLPNNPFDLYSLMSQYGNITIEGCRYLSRIVSTEGVYAASIDNLCVSGYPPSKAIFKYIYLGIFAEVIINIMAYLAINKHLNILSTAANK